MFLLFYNKYIPTCVTICIVLNIYMHTHVTVDPYWRFAVYNVYVKSTVVCRLNVKQWTTIYHDLGNTK